MISKKLRIAHVCLASSFTENMLYQENVLSEINKKDGHDVLVISDCTFFADGRISKTQPVDEILGNGVRLVRLEFFGSLLPAWLKNRIRYSPQLSKILIDFHPDVILHHSLAGFSMLSAGGYKKSYPETRLYLDNHADFNNSAQSSISRIFQYKIINRMLWKGISRYVDKVFYVSDEARDFLIENYGVPEDHMEFYPLGGHIKGDMDRISVRKSTRNNLNIKDNEVVFIHTGKFDKLKRTVEVLRAFESIDNGACRMLIVGALGDDIKSEAEEIISKNPRIENLGWMSGEDLMDVLTASDCYVQPGGQSATLQMAICCGLPVIVYPHPSHDRYLNNNGKYVRSFGELRDAMKLLNDKMMLSEMSKASLNIARQILDYKKLAQRLYE